MSRRPFLVYHIKVYILLTPSQDSSGTSTYPQSQRPDHIPDLSLGYHDRLVRLSVEQVKLPTEIGDFHLSDRSPICHKIST
jgi:hypothetical protein